MTKWMLSNMNKYRKKERIVNAVRWYRHVKHDHVMFYPIEYEDSLEICDDCNQIKGEHGIIRDDFDFLVCPGDWVVDVGNTFFPCKPDLFDMCYDPVV